MSRITQEVPRLLYFHVPLESCMEYRLIKTSVEKCREGMLHNDCIADKWGSKYN